METEPSPEIATPVTISDESLVHRLRDGDTGAGEELVKRHCPALMRYLQRLAGNDQLAEELHQQAWISVLDHLDRFDPSSGGGGFKAWLFRIATNKANDYWRSRGREKNVTQGLRLVTEETAPDASFRLDSSEQQQKLRAAIDSLPQNQKQVVLLRYYSNLKFVEIAEMLGCPLNTALGRMHKAMLRLKEIMGQ
ncbi:MAG: RNA polymerase sigma factor [Planctomycetota bacterium]|nr:RNA polymerase sigma factor [Planctomycetota bacterium]